jgi:hypothetical protein
MKRSLRWLIFCVTLISTTLAANFVLERHSYGDPTDFLLPMAAMTICASFALLFSNLALVGHHRMRTRSGRYFASLVIIVGLYCLIYTLPRIVDLNQTSSGQIEGLTQAATQVAVIPQSISVPNHKSLFGASAMYGMFFTRFDVISIYGVNERESQDRILQQFEQYHRIHHTRPLHVEFYERENWTT